MHGLTKHVRVVIATSFCTLWTPAHGPALAQEPPRYVLQWGSQGNAHGQFNTLSDLATAPDGSVFVLENLPNNRMPLACMIRR